MRLVGSFGPVLGAGSKAGEGGSGGILLFQPAEKPFATLFAMTGAALNKPFKAALFPRVVFATVGLLLRLLRELLHLPLLLHPNLRRIVLKAAFIPTKALPFLQLPRQRVLYTPDTW